MAVWTAVAAWAYSEPRRRNWPLLLLDLAVACAAMYASRFVIDRQVLEQGAATLPMAWVAGPVLAFAIAKGRRLAALAALTLGAVDGLIRGFTNAVTLNGAVLLLLAGVIVGYLYSIAAAAEGRMQQATELEAANRERERLARTIHDSVLQVLALIQRRGAELGGEAAELGRLAGEQGATLRTLVGVGVVESPTNGGEVDLRALVSQYASPLVSVAVPATPVPAASGLGGGGARRGGGGAGERHRPRGHRRASLGAHRGRGRIVTVTVRDEGVGMAPTRLAEAEAAGRLGVAQSIKGRIRDVGGTVTITSAPGEGTEVEMRVPRQPVRA